METENKISLSRRNTAEQNKAARIRAVWGSPEMRQLRESIKTRHGWDMKEGIGRNKLNPTDASFNWGKFNAKIRETNSSSGQTQLLRAGVQTAVNNLYPVVPTTYEDW